MAKKKPRNWMGTAASTFLIAILVLGGTAGLHKGQIDAERTAALESPGSVLHEVPGTVAKVASGGKSSSRILHVAFTTLDGSTVSTRVYTQGSNRKYSKNQSVGVVYVEAMPQAARLALEPGKPYTVSVGIVLAVVAWSIALVLGWLAIRDIWPKAKKAGSQKPRAPRRGRKVRARR